MKSLIQSFNLSGRVVAGHFGPDVQLTPRFGQLDLALALGQFFFLLGGALVVTVGAADAQDVMR
jgi:hypothetical protein